jgi:hypothetical protein
MDRVEIRPPRLARIWLVGFGTVWCGAMTVAAVATIVVGDPAAIVPVGMLVLGIVVLSRGARLGVVADRDQLVVHNNWSARTIARGDIEDFRIGVTMFGVGNMKTVSVLLTDGTMMSLDSTGRMSPFPGGRQRVEGNLELLRSWLNPDR